MDKKEIIEQFKKEFECDGSCGGGYFYDHCQEENDKELFVKTVEFLTTKLDQLVNLTRDEQIVELNESQRNIYNAFIQCFEDKGYHIDKFLFWIIKNVNVEQSVFLHNHNQIPQPPKEKK